MSYFCHLSDSVINFKIALTIVHQVAYYQIQELQSPPSTSVQAKSMSQCGRVSVVKSQAEQSPYQAISPPSITSPESVSQHRPRHWIYIH